MINGFFPKNGVLGRKSTYEFTPERHFGRESCEKCQGVILSKMTSPSREIHLPLREILAKL